MSKRDEGRARQGAAGGRRLWLPWVTVAAVVVAILLAVGAFLQMRDIENGLLSIVAEEQDAYVELVVDQINVRPDRDDAQIIEDILGAIDADASQYWALTRDGAVVFVRDVTETNSYRGLPEGAFFGEGAAQAFYEGLSADRATHAEIEVDGKRYIASGQAFEYQGALYRIALLTNEDTVLDDNALLGARSRLAALLGVEGAVLLFSAIWLAARRDRAMRAAEGARREAADLERTVGRLNERIARNRQFDTDTRLWSQEAAEQFDASLGVRGRSAWVAHVQLADASALARFLERMSVAFGEEVARFAGEGDADVYVLFLAASRDEAERLLDGALGSARPGAAVQWRTMGARSGDGADAKEEG